MKPSYVKQAREKEAWLVKGVAGGPEFSTPEFA